tara:strand:+ start:114 stop:323 length:210 start_codon:yes stop_codon:yes gene_type:complete
MTVNSKEQERAEYRERIKALIATVEFLSGGPVVPDVVEMALQSAYWTLDKYSKKPPVIDENGEVQWELL